MTKPRGLSKAEIMDAAKAAAETGLCAVIRMPTGEEIIFTNELPKRTKPASPTPEEKLAGWLNEGKARGAA